MATYYALMFHGFHVNLPSAIFTLGDSLWRLFSDITLLRTASIIYFIAENEYVPTSHEGAKRNSMQFSNWNQSSIYVNIKLFQTKNDKAKNNCFSNEYFLKNLFSSIDLNCFIGKVNKC